MSLFLSSHAAEEELYQNYQEKALHNDSDEDAEARKPKPDKDIVVQYRPIRTSWSQLSVVRMNSRAVLTCLSASLAYSVYSVSAEPWNSSALRNAAVSSLAAGHTHPPTPAAFLCPPCCLSGSSSCSSGWAGRQLEPQEVSEALLVLEMLFELQ